MKNIFISSTFRDMQAERDLVQEKVLPALRSEARKYGDNVGAIDLRWGVDTSSLETDEGSAKVLSVCLDEIERSHPYMLIFLGERYGWIPKKELIEKAIRNREDKYKTDDFEKSVTALEIEYGALSEQYGDLNHCIVCFREPVTAMMDAETAAEYKEQEERGIQKLHVLKDRIRKDLGAEDRLLTYTCTWDSSSRTLKNFMVGKEPLEEVLINHFIKLFRDDWKKYEHLSWQEKEQLVFRALMESKLRSFVGREELLESYYQKCVFGTKPLILQGEVGSGKTALMSKLVDRLQKEGKNVCPLFCGVGNMSTSAERLVQQMLYYVENLRGEKHFSESMSYEESMRRLLKLCDTLQEKVYFFIDALDQLFQDEHVDKLDFTVDSKNVQMVLSCTDVFELTSAKVYDINTEHIPILHAEDIKKVIRGILKADARDSYEDLERELLKKKNIGNPLFISLLIQRLNMMDQEELLNVHTGQEIAAYGLEIIRSMPETLQEAAVSVLNNAVSKINDKDPRELKEFLWFLAVSRNGLRMEDLKKIFEARQEAFPVLDVTLLLRYMDSFFYLGEHDRIEFTHKIIRQGLLENFTEKCGYEEEINSYVKTLDSLDAFRMQEGMYYARITKDYEFARTLIEEACDREPEDLLRAIKEQAIADEGAFFCQMLFGENTEESKVRNIMYYLNERFDLSSKEMRTKLNFSEALIYCARELHGKHRNKKTLLELGRSSNRKGEVLGELGRHEEALVYYKETLAYYEEALQYGTEDSEENELLNLSTGYHNVGFSLEHHCKPEEAFGYYEKSLYYLEKIYKDHKTVVHTEKLISGYNSIANVLNSLGRRKEAYDYFKKATQMAEELYEDQNVQVDLEIISVCHNNMGLLLCETERYSESLEYCEKGVHYSEEWLKIQKNLKSMQQLAVSYSALGKTYYAVENYNAALVFFEKSLCCAKELHEEQNSIASLYDLIFSYSEIWPTLYILERYEEAAECHKEMIQYGEKIHELNDSLVSLEQWYQSYNNMVRLLHEIGHLEEEVDYYKKMMICLEQWYQQEKSEETRSVLQKKYYDFGDLLCELGRTTEAFFCFRKSIGWE